MDAQEQHDLELKNAKVTKGSRKRLEDLLQANGKSSSEDSQPSTQDPLAVMRAQTGATSEELLEEIEAAGF
jgi:hypothetical protein